MAEAMDVGVDLKGDKNLYKSPLLHVASGWAHGVGLTHFSGASTPGPSHILCLAWTPGHTSFLVLLHPFFFVAISPLVPSVLGPSSPQDLAHDCWAAGNP